MSFQTLNKPYLDKLQSLTCRNDQVLPLVKLKNINIFQGKNM